MILSHILIAAASDGGPTSACTNDPLIPRSNWRFDEVSHRTTPYLVFCFDTYCPFLNVCTDNLDQESVSLYLQNNYAYRLGVLSCHRFPRFADKLKMGLPYKRSQCEGCQDDLEHSRGIDARPRSLRCRSTHSAVHENLFKWPVVQEFDIDDEGKTYKEHQVDQVA
ncbi:hypothetical protein GQ600_16108 [Phytophthora cactorum]|nr:hypothetical protein GQ600_16108 [Phytophthora cactorum]